MSTVDDLDQLAGDPVLAAFVADVRAYASGPAPTPGPALAAVLVEGLGAGRDELVGVPVPDPTPARFRRRRSLVDRLQGRGVRAALATAVVGLSLFGTGAAGALPEPVQAAVEEAAGVVGIELPVPASRLEQPPSSEVGGSDDPARPGDPAVPSGDDQGTRGESTGRTDPDADDGAADSPEADDRPAADSSADDGDDRSNAGAGGSGVDGNQTDGNGQGNGGDGGQGNGNGNSQGNGNGNSSSPGNGNGGQDAVRGGRVSGSGAPPVPTVPGRTTADPSDDEFGQGRGTAGTR